MINQTTPDSSVEPSALNLVEFIKHHSHFWPFKRSDGLGQTLLNILVKNTFSFESNLCKAEIKSCDVDWPHCLITAGKFFLKPRNHLVIKHASFCVCHQHLTQFYWDHFMKDFHQCWSDIKQEGFLLSIFRSIVAVDDIAQLLRVKLIHIIQNCAFQCAPKCYWTILTLRIRKNCICDWLAIYWFLVKLFYER